jgi:hypothetical protein
MKKLDIGKLKQPTPANIPARPISANFGRRIARMFRLLVSRRWFAASREPMYD